MWVRISPHGQPRKDTSGASARRWRNTGLPIPGCIPSMSARRPDRGILRRRRKAVRYRSTFSSIRWRLPIGPIFRRIRGISRQLRGKVFAQALDISAYSLIALTRAAVPLMPEGGSVIALSYLGGEKVVPGYNVMGVAKSALETCHRDIWRSIWDPKKSASTSSPPARSERSRPWRWGDR